MSDPKPSVSAASLLPDLRARTALVTGAASGIGRAIACELARAGAAVVVADRDEAGGVETVARIERDGGRASFVPVDLRDREQCRRLVATAAERWGEVDILVNNAGLQHVRPVVEFEEARWDELLAVMLTAPFLLCKQCVPAMVAKGWGRVINLASAHGLVASRNKSAYCAAKHGLIGFTRVLALEVADRGVTVNAICPGWVRTPLVERQLPDLARQWGIPEAEVAAAVAASMPLRRALEPREIAGMALYLCSDLAAGVTGAALAIDGGWTAQ